MSRPVGGAIDQHDGVQAGQRLAAVKDDGVLARAQHYGGDGLTFDVDGFPAPRPLAAELADLVVEEGCAVHRDPEGIMIPVQPHCARPEVCLLYTSPSPRD